MVVKLTGSINGTAITLERESGDRWTAIIPSIPSGVYIVDLTAWDEAGELCVCDEVHHYDRSDSDVHACPDRGV